MRTWDRVVQGLKKRGRRLNVPWLRGYGGSTFRSAETMRSGQVAAFAQDAIDLLDAMGFSRDIVVGHDRGAGAAYAMAESFPDRIDRIIARASGCETRITLGDQIHPEQAEMYWSQWCWHTDRGCEALRNNPKRVCKSQWKT